MELQIRQEFAKQGPSVPGSDLENTCGKAKIALDPSPA